MSKSNNRRINSFRASAGLMDGLSHVSYQEGFETTELSQRPPNNIIEIIEELYKLTYDPRSLQCGVIPRSGRINKNQVLALVLIRLVKYKYLQGVRFTYEMELLRGIQMQSNNDVFVLVLRMDGRIVAMSDEAEQHLEKPMRLIYAQSVNIFDCLDQADAAKLRSILNTPAHSRKQEHQLVCILRLPKGKRPSRLREDVKTTSVIGHFYSCDDLSATSSGERLFIARCAALMPSETTKSSSSRARGICDSNTTRNSAFTLTLNADMSICEVSPRLSTVLGYSNGEMVGNWFGRYLPAIDGEKFEALRRKYLQNEQQSRQSPVSVREIFDMYTNCGDGRLTFLCRIRSTCEPRSKVIKFTVVAELIDPSLRHEYAQYISSEPERQPEAEQVNLVPSSVSTASEDAIVANSPTYTNMAENIHGWPLSNNDWHQAQLSPINEPFSSVVAPLRFSDELWSELFDIDDSQHSTASSDFQSWSSLSLENAFFNNRFSEELSDLADEYLSDLYMSDQCERKKSKKCHPASEY